MSPSAESLRRRSFLRGAAVGTAVGVGALGVERAAAAGSDGGGDPAGRSIPFEGLHQAGITTPQQAAATFASFDVTAVDRTALGDLFRTLTDRIRFLTAGGQGFPSLCVNYDTSRCRESTYFEGSP